MLDRLRELNGTNVEDLAKKYRLKSTDKARRGKALHIYCGVNGNSPDRDGQYELKHISVNHNNLMSPRGTFKITMKQDDVGQFIKKLSKIVLAVTDYKTGILLNSIYIDLTDHPDLVAQITQDFYAVRNAKHTTNGVYLQNRTAGSKDSVTRAIYGLSSLMKEFIKRGQKLV